MQFGLVISVLLHVAILGWTLISIHSQRQLISPEPEPDARMGVFINTRHGEHDGGPDNLEITHDAFDRARDSERPTLCYGHEVFEAAKRMAGRQKVHCYVLIVGWNRLIDRVDHKQIVSMRGKYALGRAGSTGGLAG